VKPNIALSGAMYAGKSTVANVLAEDYGYHRVSFAAPLKGVAALAYGEVDKSATYTVTGRDGKLHEVSGRQVLQGIGQTVKDFDLNFWLRCFDNERERYGDLPLVLDDMRFLFEMEWLRADGWIIVSVDTRTQTRLTRAERISGRMPTMEELNHESERDIPKIFKEADMVIDGEEDAYENAAGIMREFSKGARS
jgi:dephospho-CoA kinase